MSDPREHLQDDPPPSMTADYWPDSGGKTYSSAELPPEGETIRLRQEEMVTHKEMRHMGDVEIRTEVEQVPAEVEVEAQREDVEVEHVPVGRVVAERQGPHQEGDVLVVPVYEEQLVVSKRLVLREELHIRRVPSTEMQVFEDTLRRERLVVEDADHTGALHERYPTEEEQAPGTKVGSFFEDLKRKMMQP